MSDLLAALAADLPPGLTARRDLRTDDGPDPSDADAVVDLVQRCDLAAVGELDSGRDEVLEMLTSPETVHEDTFLVHEGHLLRAFVWVEQRPGHDETWTDVYVDPSVDGAALLAAGLAHGERAARRQWELAGGDAWKVRSGAFGTDEALENALAAAGFTIVRRFWRMRADLAAIDAVMPPLPEGGTVRLVRDDDGRRAVHAVLEESFADHWNHAERTYDAFAAAVVGRMSEDPDGWWLLEVDGEPAAICLLDESRADLGDGYVRTLGVRRQFRGQGLAQHLLLRAFAYYREKGRAGVQLGVDADSPTGANHLYEKVGMRAVRVIDAWAKPL
jgi:mycothiol synthase